MDIPELLRDVQQRKGYSGVEDMAWRESLRLGVRIPTRTLYSWMTENPRYSRRPLTVASLRLIADIAELPFDEVAALVEDVRTPLT